MHRLSRISSLPLIVALTSLGGCVSPDFGIPHALSVKKNASDEPTGTVHGEQNQSRSTNFFQTPSPNELGRTASTTQSPPPAPSNEVADIRLMFDQVPINTFIQAVFAGALKRNVATDEAVARRTDLVTLRTAKPQTPSDVFKTVRMLLKSYGIAVSEYGSTVRITPDNAQSGYLPEIQRGRALPDTPLALRPIFQLVELQSVRPADITGWLNTMFAGKVKVQDDNARQAVMLSGQADDIQAVLAAIQVLDQPTMRGRHSVRIVPAYWSADEMTKRLAEVLQAQGFTVSTQAITPAPLILLPINALNSVVVFSATEAALNHVLNWVRELDQPTTGRGNSGYFTYTCRFADADELAKTLQSLMTGSATAAAAATATTTTSTSGGTSTATTRPASRVVVNKSTNSLIIQGSPDEYNQWMGLLRELDRPAKAALISVTVAEVRLGDKEQLGVEWALKQAHVAGNSIGTLSTMGSFGTSSIGGMVAKVVSGAGDTRLLVEALASSSRARVLSNPSIVTRNGETATIQVGQEVPVITSQQSNANTNTSTGGILQTIQYRQTGVILKVRPVIHAGGRVELDVTQEVSSAAETTSGVSTSPTISTRKVDTKLSVTDGSTILMGGLMSQTDSGANSGIPLLKDIPLIGAFFRYNNKSVDKTELLVMITPYVINDDYEATQITDAFRGQMSWAGSSRTEATAANTAAGQAPTAALRSPSTVPAETQAPPGSVGTPYKPQASLPTTQTTNSTQAPSEQKPADSVVKTQQSSPSGPLIDLPGGGKGSVVTDNDVLDELRKSNTVRPKK